MAYGDDSDLIRRRAWTKYIQPQILKGLERIDVHIRPLMKELEAEGFRKNHPRQFCKALQKKSFLHEKGLILEGLDGPASGTSTTVILHYKVTDEAKPRPAFKEVVEETSAERALRLTEKLRGLMKDEIVAHGGTEGFLRWVRSEDEEAA